MAGAWPGAADSAAPGSPKAEMMWKWWDGSMPTTSRFCGLGGRNLKFPYFCQFLDDLPLNGFCCMKPVFFWLLWAMRLSLISTLVRETHVVNAVSSKREGAFERNLSKKRLRAEVDQSNCWHYMASNWLLGITTIVAKECKRWPLQEIASRHYT